MKSKIPQKRIHKLTNNRLLLWNVYLWWPWTFLTFRGIFMARYVGGESHDTLSSMYAFYQLTKIDACQFVCSAWSTRTDKQQFICWGTFLFSVFSQGSLLYSRPWRLSLSSLIKQGRFQYCSFYTWWRGSLINVINTSRDSVIWMQQKRLYVLNQVIKCFVVCRLHTTLDALWLVGIPHTLYLTFEIDLCLTWAVFYFRSALKDRDWNRMAQLMDQNFELRR